MGLAVIVQPVGHFLDVRRHIQVVIHATAARGNPGLGHCPPATTSQHFGESLRALRPDAALPPPVIHLRNIGSAGAALDTPSHSISERDTPANIVGRGMPVSEFPASGGLPRHPLYR